MEKVFVYNYLVGTKVAPLRLGAGVRPEGPFERVVTRQPYINAPSKACAVAAAGYPAKISVSMVVE
ncbi:hypothetical protein BLA39750_01264 [Burkholderia lata]|uniref:Uncharacterized protein n=1 Tax=Burkholderia lata (strain ATCC 17760 / DSM 23089 / LMG 22485 / NCIMB 9086 / R18194 / 383) TaxID=482957 RepID=A0A6P2V1K2_BURL3|nr:hypothetical protein BLA39750_01264 [Burkholderia lata]